MSLVLRTLLNPELEDILLSRAEFLVGIRRWHHLIRITCINSHPKFALLQVTRDNGLNAIALYKSPGALIEAQLGFTFFRILAMTGKTVFREDGSYVAIEPDVFACGQLPRQCKQEKEHPELHANK